MSSGDSVLPDAGRMTLMEHLVELRQRLVYSAITIVICAIVCWVLYDWIFDFLIAPYCDAIGTNSSIIDDSGSSCALYVRDPLGGFSVRMTVAGYGGLMLAMPVLLWHVWKFITPGLYAHEKRHAIPFLVSALLLFVLGAGLAYWSIPRALEFLLEIGGSNIEALFDPQPYLGFVIKMMVGFGIGFQFPILLIFLQIIGLVSNQMLRRQRRYAIVGIVSLVAVLTPSGDPFTLMVLSVPMYLFYEAAILFGVLRGRRDRKAKAKAKAKSSAGQQ